MEEKYLFLLLDSVASFNEWRKNHGYIKLDLSCANLSGANLSSADLSGANLSGADLSRANLFCVNLSCANLSGANLSSADLSGANLSGADLSRANLFCVNLSCANLSGANLYGTLKVLYSFPYSAFIFKEKIKIGCESHTPAEWRNFNDSDIFKMDGRDALKYWKKHKKIILSIHEILLTEKQ